MLRFGYCLNGPLIDSFDFFVLHHELTRSFAEDEPNKIIIILLMAACSYDKLPQQANLISLWLPEGKDYLDNHYHCGNVYEINHTIMNCGHEMK